MSKKYKEVTYSGPLKGANVSLPEDVIPGNYSPSLTNFILKNGEFRTRPRQYNYIPGTPDNLIISMLTSFMDANNILHTCAVTQFGLWQLNAKWRQALVINPESSWSLVGKYSEGPGIPFPSSFAVFINKLFFSVGSIDLWMWDGIASAGAPRIWQAGTYFIQGSNVIDSNGNIEIAQNSGLSGTTVPVWNVSLTGTTTDNVITWVNNGKAPQQSGGLFSAAIVDAANGIRSGCLYLIELNSQLLMLNTIEGNAKSRQQFPQRVRWCPSGLPTIWDSNVNIGAGYVDELDVPDSISGGFTVGTTGFILRTNGVTEITSNGGSGTNPWIFNHLWASDRGIGNVFPFGYASFGPLGVMISDDDIYNVSLGGFRRMGGGARDAIYNDIALATNNLVGSIVPYYQNNYSYNHYRLAVPINNDTVTWCYSFEDDLWTREFISNLNVAGNTRWSYTS